LTYVYERPDRAALDELETLARHVGEELAAWRRRCLKAEAELQDGRGGKGGGTASGPELIQARQRIIELELDNQSLRQRVDAARDRLRLLSNRLAFLEQDTEDGAA
jgi:hypothetical protein